MVDVALRGKVRQWALQSKGYLPLSPGVVVTPPNTPGNLASKQDANMSAKEPLRDFEQAHTVHEDPLLRDRLDSTYVPIPQFVRLDALTMDADNESPRSGRVGVLKRRESVVWANIKSARRAVEKVASVYGGDPSWLLDLCRQRLVFETVADMARCIESIAGDKEVIVERVKNRMTESYNPELSSGYR
jgi:hypothetical protein